LAGPGVVVATRDGHLDVEAEDLAALNALIDRLRAGSVVITEVTPQRSALEDVFIEVVTSENGVRGPGSGDRVSDPEPGTPEAVSELLAPENRSSDPAARLSDTGPRIPDPGADGRGSA
jgi:hypothetical protein